MHLLGWKDVMSFDLCGSFDSLRKMMEFCHGICLLRKWWNFAMELACWEEWCIFSHPEFDVLPSNDDIFHDEICMHSNEWTTFSSWNFHAWAIMEFTAWNFDCWVMMEFPSLNLPADEDWWNVGICHGMCQHRETKKEQERSGWGE